MFSIPEPIPGGIVEIAKGHRENQIDTISSIFGLTQETI